MKCSPLTFQFNHIVNLTPSLALPLFRRPHQQCPEARAVEKQTSYNRAGYDGGTKMSMLRVEPLSLSLAVVAGGPRIDGAMLAERALATTSAKA
jgi:hypothetical protein